MKKVLFLITIILLLNNNIQASLVQSEYTTLLSSDFNNGSAEGWSLSPGWYIKEVDGSYALYGEKHSFAVPIVDNLWTDYEATFRFKIDEGVFHFNVRYNLGAVFSRYFIGIWNNGSCYLSKQVGNDFFKLQDWNDAPFSGWHRLKVRVSGNQISVYIDDILKASSIDNFNPIRTGIISFETPADDVNNQWTSSAYFDDIEVKGSRFTQKNLWEKMGGPIGGLGYDIRIHPHDKSIMFVTDNPSGVQKSVDGGSIWRSKNKGITARSGPSGDGVPNFALTIDPNNPDIVWAGTQNIKGIFKSVDGGETWQKKDNGIEDNLNISFRGFAIKPGDSNIVLAAAEITTGVLGEEFDKAKGQIYRTEDGGEHWQAIWQGDSLARVLIFNPNNPDIVYCSTGIFDREAWNTVGLGVLKSTDGGKTWEQINNGIDNLFVGFLEMHPLNPDILFAAAGMNVDSFHGHWGGIYKTSDGGNSWRKVLGDNYFSVVVVSHNNPDVVYAGGSSAFYRSDDGGATWKKFYKQDENCWGPPGVRAGFPISAVVDFNDPMSIFTNNYGGGVFRSTDGAKTWIDASHGYTGATLWKVTPAQNGYLYSIGRSGPFMSGDNGKSWTGLAYSPASWAEWNSIISNPKTSLEVIASDEGQGIILKSSNEGRTWREVFRHPKADGKVYNRHGFRVLAYALSNPLIVYGGMSQDRRKTDGDMTIGDSFGMYKSINGGETWFPINQGLEYTNGNILALAVHPQNSNIVYIGTFQDGIYKSVDGGSSWFPVSNGLGSMQIRSLAIAPGNPDVILVGLGEGSGIFRSENGGQSWESSNQGIAPECPSSLQKVGEVKTGISFESSLSISSDKYSLPWSKITSILFDPFSQGRVFAADLGLGIFYSEDNGYTWIPLNEGLSTKAVSDLGISNERNFLYAASQGEGVFRLQINNISISPASKDFGNVTVRSVSLPQTFTVSNSALVNLAIDTITITGTNFSEFTVQNDQCSGKIVAPSGSCTLDVVFSPTSASIESALLSIPSDDPDSPILNVSLKGTGVKLPITLASPANGRNVTACSLYDVPTFRWEAVETFKRLEIQFSKDNFSTISVKVKGKSGINELLISSKTWKKIIGLPGSEGTVYWRIIGIKAYNTQVSSDVFSLIIENPEIIENAQISHVSKTTLPPPILSWQNNCNIKFKVWVGNYPDFTSPLMKKKVLTFTIKNPNDNGGIFAKSLTSGQWNAIRQVVGNISGSSIYWHVESWDGLKRYTKTEVQSFTLTD